MEGSNSNDDVGNMFSNHSNDNKNEQSLNEYNSEIETSNISDDYLHDDDDFINDNRWEDPEIAELRYWAVTCNIPLTRLDKLLKILRKRLFFTYASRK